MSIFFSHRKIIISLFLMTFTFLGIGQENADLFEAKWTQAQEYLADGQMESLLVTIKELEGLANPKNTTHLGKIVYLQGEYWHEKEDWAKAIIALNTVTEYLQGDTAELEYLAESYLLLGSCYHELEELDNSIFHYKKSLAFKQKIYDKPHVKLSNLYFNIGFLFQEKEQFIKSDEAFEEGLAILKEIHAEENAEFADFYEEFGFNAFSKGDFEDAIKFLQKALVLKQSELGENHEDLAYTYNYLGNAYYQNELFAEAINYLYKALQIVEKQQKRDVFQEGILHFSIGRSYSKLREYDKAFIYLDKALDIDKNNDFLLPAVHRIKGIEASFNKNNTAANIHFDIAIDGFKKIGKNEKDYLLNTYKEIAKHHVSTNNLEQALTAINKAVNLGEKYYQERPIELFELYLIKGKCFRLLKNNVQATFAYSASFKANGETRDKKLLTIKQLKNLVSLNLEYAELYQAQGKKETTNLLKIDSLLASTILLVDYINKNYQERSTKENFIDEYHRVFSMAIKTKFSLHTLTEDKKYLEAAFNLSEKSKNLILLETIKNINAFELAGIPKDLTEQEKKLRNNITYLESQRYEENQKTRIDRGVIRELNGNIFDLKQERQALLEKIGEEYPNYYKLKFEPAFITTKAIQQNILQPNQTILEYFVDESTIYAFLVQKDNFQVFALPIQKDLVVKINQFRESIYSYRPPSINDNGGTTTLINNSNQLGFELYQALIKPIQAHLTQRIILITDGALSYLPFDALLTAAPNEDENFTNVTYLLEAYQISYAHSANWLSELYGKLVPDFDQNFVGIAPVFKGNNSNDVSDFRIGLGPLKYNQEEVHNIKKNIGGTVITGIAATRKAFLEYIQKGQILHLATHGKSNDLQGDYSYLAFSEPQDTSGKQFLYVKDLFNLTIPADLVVLSACETGLGQMKRGEGIVGIGKGFSYAGAKSMVTTLWRVSDNSTANFMPIFYKNLKAGLAKDEALWSAKKEFIKLNRGSGHPFFWAGYVAYGNMNPIEFQHRHWSISFPIGISLVIGLFAFFLRRFFMS